MQACRGVHKHVPMHAFGILLPKVPYPGFLSHSDRILASSFLLRWSLANQWINNQGQFQDFKGESFLSKTYLSWKIWPISETVELVWICARRFSSTAASYFLLWYRHNRSSLSALNVVYIYLIIMKQSTKVTLENHNFSDSQPFKCCGSLEKSWTII